MKRAEEEETDHELPAPCFQLWIKQAVGKLSFCSKSTVTLRRVMSEKGFAGCSKWPSSAAAASEEARRTLAVR
jgi:hypothetical protein